MLSLRAYPWPSDRRGEPGTPRGGRDDAVVGDVKIGAPDLCGWRRWSSLPSSPPGVDGAGDAGGEVSLGRTVCRRSRSGGRVAAALSITGGWRRSRRPGLGQLFDDPHLSARPRRAHGDEDVRLGEVDLLAPACSTRGPRVRVDGAGVASARFGAGKRPSSTPSAWKRRLDGNETFPLPSPALGLQLAARWPLQRGRRQS